MGSANFRETYDMCRRCSTTTAIDKIDTPGVAGELSVELAKLYTDANQNGISIRRCSPG
jgi:hypothetical protein